MKEVTQHLVGSAITAEAMKKPLPNIYRLIKSTIVELVVILGSVIPSECAPAGLCLHAYSPEAPAEKIECFEFASVEQTSTGYRFFVESGGTANVTSYRYRGLIIYQEKLAPGNPEFDRYLNQIEECARTKPSTRRYLNPRLLNMREISAKYAEQQKISANLPEITIASRKYFSPQLGTIQDGKLVLAHRDGLAKIEIEKITDNELHSLAKIDPKAAAIVVVDISNNRIWNPKYSGISNGIIKITHEKGVTHFDLDSISDDDYKKIVHINTKFGLTKNIVITGKKLWNPKYLGVSHGAVNIAHEKGEAIIDLDTLSDNDFATIIRLDPKFKQTTNMIVGRTKLWNPQFVGVSNGFVKINHEKGEANFDLDSLSDDDFAGITKLDSNFAQTKSLVLAGQKIWNPEFDSISSSSVKVKHEKGILELDFDTISDKDKATIMSWSDGTWKIGKPGFYNPNPENDSYGEIILESGRFYNNIKLTGRSGDDITIKTSNSELKISIRKIVDIPGITPKDSGRIEAWVNEIIEDRITNAVPETSTSVVLFDEAKILRVTEVRVKILQVLDEGVLASTFIGRLHKGTEKVQVTKTINVKHPITDEIITKTLNTSVEDHEVTEDITDDLCYIVGNTSNLVDGEIVKADSMRLLGRFQYTDVRGAQRSVRKYHVD